MYTPQWRGVGEGRVGEGEKLSRLDKNPQRIRKLIKELGATTETSKSRTSRCFPATQIDLSPSQVRTSLRDTYFAEHLRRVSLSHHSQFLRILDRVARDKLSFGWGEEWSFWLAKHP